MAAADDRFARIEVTSREALAGWLDVNHKQADSVWLVLHKKGGGRPYVPLAEIVETLISYGWIDSLPRKLDENRSMLRASPRKPKSAWSAVNKAVAERLIAEGRMREPGLATITLAQKTGTWHALDSVEALTIPDDLAAAFRTSEPARAHFEAFPRSVKRGILEWISTAKKPETRAARIAETAAKAQQNIRANQWKK
ncbi:MAG: YdeI/OmpD-associated family protein [Aestuariivirga sp.]|nr:YdeI/OmpD-associated family protein [Aestuariivirga sp.]